MPLDQKTLAFVQIPDTLTEVYTAPLETKAFIHNILLHNSGSAGKETITITFDDLTNELTIFEVDVSGKDTFIIDFIGEGFIMAPGTILRASTDTATTVTLKIDGTEET